MRTSVVVGSIAFVVAACSSSGGGSGSPDAACNSYASALCNKVDGCAHFGVVVEYGDVATCVARTAKACVLGVNAPGSGATTAKVETCANALPSYACDDLFAHKPPAGCETPAGTLADGAACADDAQCQNRHCKKNGATCGACGKRAAAGEPCTGSGDCEENGLVCGNGTCVTPGQAGATCDQGHPCVSSLFCKGGTCAKPGAAGAACDPQQPGACDAIAGLFCNPQSKVCQQAQTAAAGQPCATVGSGYALCSAGSYCVGSTGSRTCLAAAADGAACDDLKGPRCLSPANCDNGVCTLEDPAACK